MSNVSWTRLIRFHPATSPDRIIYGEPIGSDDELVDIGALADARSLRAKVIQFDSRDGPLSPSARVTDEVVQVGQLLGPLGMYDVTDIKCIGLNYKKHSEPSIFLSSRSLFTPSFRSPRSGSIPPTLPFAVHQTRHFNCRLQRGRSDPSMCARRRSRL